LVADAVTIEPVSWSDFPANREKYREVSITVPVRPKMALGKSTKLALADKIPYSEEQGSF
jgi:hypothetical protein